MRSRPSFRAPAGRSSARRAAALRVTASPTAAATPCPPRPPPVPRDHRESEANVSGGPAGGKAAPESRRRRRPAGGHPAGPAPPASLAPAAVARGRPRRDPTTRRTSATRLGSSDHPSRTRMRAGVRRVRLRAGDSEGASPRAAASLGTGAALRAPCFQHGPGRPTGMARACAGRADGSPSACQSNHPAAGVFTLITFNCWGFHVNNIPLPASAGVSGLRADSDGRRGGPPAAARIRGHVPRY
jgi:hypothetical protein